MMSFTLLIYRFGINVIGVSSDGDSRLLKAMMKTIKFDLTPGSNLQEIQKFLKCVQDSIHMGTKMRNSLLNSAILLSMGNHTVSIVHIEMLLDKVPKEIHGLTYSDIRPDDRQNYSSLEKLMENRVIDALEKYIPDSMGTVMYLKLCKQITSSYLDDNLEPNERLYRIWHANYFLRSWRMFIQSKDNQFTLSDNFVSRNLYMCVEINAHSMVYLIRDLRDSQQSNLFIPSKFSSQSCESTFRQMRSMGTQNFTKINFNLFELLHLIARVDLSNKIVWSRKELRFPRIETKRLGSNINIVLPSDQQILTTMERARRDALEISRKFGMDPGDKITNFDTKILKTLQEEKNVAIDEDYISEEDEIYEDFNAIEQLFGVEPSTSTMNTGTDSSANTLANTTENENSNFNLDENLSERRGFVEVVDPDGTITKMRKSTFVWKLLENNGIKMSSDRRHRVKESSEPKRKKQKKSMDINAPGEEQILFKSTNIQIGEWAVFKINDEYPINCQDAEQILVKNCLFGIILGFKYINEKGRVVQHKSRYAKTLFNEEQMLNLQVLGIWYICNENRTLTPIDNKKKVEMNIKNYIATVKEVVTKTDNSGGNSKQSYAIPCEFSDLATLIFEMI